jgi:hypothetical protein
MECGLSGYECTMKGNAELSLISKRWKGKTNI